VFRNDFIGGPTVGFPDNQTRRDVEQFLLAFDSNIAPVVGQQITLDASTAGTVGARVDLLIARAAAGDCDLVGKGVAAGEARGRLRLGSGSFISDRDAEPQLTDAALRAIATTPGNTVTYMCVPLGSGMRVGVDRDEDGFLDRDEIDAGRDPADPTSFPGSASVLVPTKALELK